MLNVNPTNSSEIAKSIQRDYQQATESHRIVNRDKESGQGSVVVQICLVLSTAISVISVASFIF